MVQPLGATMASKPNFYYIVYDMMFSYLGVYFILNINICIFYYNF